MSAPRSGGWPFLAPGGVTDGSSPTVHRGSPATDAERGPSGGQPRTPDDRFVALLLLQLREPVIAIDAHGVITCWNRGAEELLGWPASEALGRRPLDLLDVGPAPAEPALAPAAARSEGFDAELLVRRRDGAVRHLELRATMLGGPHGEPQGFVISARDVTDERRALAELRAALLLREEVLGVVAHDLRSPLNIIAMEAELLRGRVAPLAGEETPAEVIAHAARRMDRLIEDLLEGVLLGVGSRQLPAGPVDALPVLREAVAAGARLAVAAGLSISLVAPTRLPPVRADRSRLLQILDNLIGNAVKFSRPPGHIEVGAAAAPGEERVRFHVRDEGCGIEEGDLPHVFERFWRTPGRRHGAGLGLAIVKSLVEGYGGRVEVESSPGAGSLFRFTLPIASDGGKNT